MAYIAEDGYIRGMQIESFQQSKKTRATWGRVKHELEDVLRMALIGVLCDCEDCDDISDMVTDREEDQGRRIAEAWQRCPVW